MKKIKQKFDEIRKFCQEHANPQRVKKYARFFKEGYDAYGLDKDTLLAQSERWIKSWHKEMTLDDYFKLGDLLVATGKYEEASFAIRLMVSYQDQFQSSHFEQFGEWLEKGIVNWGHTDVLCSLILSEFLKNNLVDIQTLGKWVTSPSKWKRRAIPVTLIEYLEINQDLDPYFEVIEPLMTDKEIFVQKGMGWFLREAWKRDPTRTERFLMKWKDLCGRTIIQYATEKLTLEYRKKFRRSKNKKEDKK